MPNPSGQTGTQVVIQPSHLDQVIGALAAQGYRVMGPSVQDGAIVYGPLASASMLPIGWTDEEEGGKYRLVPRGDAALFGYTTSPHSWKKFLHPPSVRMWQLKREGGTFRMVEDKSEPDKFAFVGVRACELRAIAIQDRVFMQGAYVEPGYKARRENAFILAVNCGQAGGNCFCVSMRAGPKVEGPYDLALTEVLEGDEHYLVIRIGSERGAEILRDVPHKDATEAEKQAAESVVWRAAQQIAKSLDTSGLKEILYRNYDSPVWEQAARRCLTCANCTMVCPTCFCTTVEDTTDLTGTVAERSRKWDSCFTVDFSYIHGGSIRGSAMSRYRQWMMHKLATWIDQYGTSGCVGCGRCITWCPVALDITEQARSIREGERR